MADQVVKITEVTNTISASLNDGSYNLLAGGTIGGNLQLGGTLTVGVNDLGHDVKFFGATSGKYLQWDESADKLIIAGDLDVTGTTTSFNSTVVTIDDPVFTIGGDTAPSSDDNKDRGIEFRYHDGSNPKVGFFGYDDSESAFTFLTAATNSSEVFSGTLGNLKVNTVYHGDGTASSPSVRFNLDTDTGIFRPTANTLAFTAGGTERLRLHSDGRLTIGGTAGQAMLQLEGGDVRVDNTRSFLTETAGGGVISAVSMNSSDNLTFGDGNFVIDVTGTAERMRLDSSGHLGIGTGSTVNAQLHVKSTGNGEVEIERASGALINLQAQAARGVIGTDSNHELQLKTNAGTRMTLSTSGSVEFAGTGGGATTIGSHIDLGDNQKVRLGASDDLQLYHDGTHSYVSNTQNAGNLIIENGGNDHDIVFRCDDGSGGVETYFYLDGSLADGTNVYTRFPDQSKILLGTGGDMGLWHDGSNSYLSSSTGDLVFYNSADDKDIIFQSDDGSGGLATYFRLDGGASASGFPQTIVPDNASIRFGDDGDLLIYHSGAESEIRNFTGDLRIVNRADDKDIIFQSDNGSGGEETYFFLDGSKSTGDPYTIFPNNSFLGFGDAGNLLIRHTGLGASIQNNGGDIDITQNTNDGDIRFYCDDGSGGTAEYFRFDGGLAHTVASKHIRFGDNVIARFGNGNDASLYHTGTDTIFENTNGDLYIKNHADDKDIIFQSDYGDGSVATYFRLDGSFGGAGYPTTLFPNDSSLRFGNSGNLQIINNGTDSYIQENNGDLYIRQSTDDKDIIFQSDDGSGGVETYFYLDGSLSSGEPNTVFPDNAHLRFGTGADFGLVHDGSHTYINNSTGNLYITNNADDKDIVFRSDDGSGGNETYFYLDGSASSGNPITVFPDNSILQIGGDFDLRISHDGTDSTINNYTGDLIIKNSADDKDIIFSCDDGSGGNETYFYLDGSASSGNPFTVFPDLSELAFGDSRDLRIKHTSSDSYISNYTGDLYIRNDATDKDIVFQSDDGSGGMTQYIRIDGSAGMTQFDKDTKHADTIKATFGNSGDLEIYHGGGSSFIKDDGDGGLYLQTNGPAIYFQDTDGNGLAQFTDGGSCFLMHNGSTKLHTTAAGVTITGDLTVSGSTNQTFNDVTVNGNLTVSGTTTTIDTANLTVEDKNIIIGNVSSPSDTTADGGGFTLKGASDYTIQWTNSTDSWHFNQGITVGVDDTGHDVKFFGATSGYYGMWDQAGNRFKVSDSAEYVAGTGNDLKMYHNGANSYLKNTTGNLYINTEVNDGDIIFQSDDGSGGTATYFYLDGSVADGTNRYTAFPDNSRLRFGTNLDLDIHHDGSNSFISQTGTGNLHIQQTVDDGDIIFKCDDGSGGTAEYFRVDGSANNVNFSTTAHFNDGVYAAFGAGHDLQIWHDGTGSNIQNNTGDLAIINTSDDKDIIFKCDDGSGGTETYFYLDGSASSGNPFTVFPDNSYLALGTGTDLLVYHDGTDSWINNATGDLYIRNRDNDKDVIFQCDDGSGGNAEYFRLDGSEAQSIFTRSVKLLDGVRLKVGTGADLNIYHDGVGVSSRIENETGPLYITNKANDADIYFQSDDGSGGVTTYFYLDGSLADGTYLNTRFNDNSRILLGTGGDFVLNHDGTNSSIKNHTGDLTIEQNADDKDIIFKSDNGSGGTETYFFLDGSLSSGSPYTTFPDGSHLTFGTGRDLSILHDGNNSYIWHNGTGNFYIDQLTDDADIIFRCDDGSGGVTEYFRLDGGEGINIFSKNVKLIDDIYLNIGGGNDFSIHHNGTNTLVANNTGNLKFTNYADDSDIIFESDDGSGGVAEYFRLDGSAAPHPRTTFPDNSTLQLGTGGDLQILNDGVDSTIRENTRHLYITNNATDGNIQFFADNGSGTATEYFRLGGGDVRSKFSKPVLMSTGQQIYQHSTATYLTHDGSNYYFVNGTGDITIQSDTADGDIKFKADSGNGSTTTEYFRVDGGEERTVFTKHTIHPDVSTAYFGSGADLRMYHNGTDSHIDNYTGNLNIVNNTDDGDINFYCDDGSGSVEVYFSLDGSLNTDGTPKTVFPDGSKLQLGSGAADLRLYHNGTNSYVENNTGDLYIQNSTDDSRIRFVCDDGAGGTTAYFDMQGSLATHDGSATTSLLTLWYDNSKIGFGNGVDMQIYHNGTNSFIYNQTGDLFIRQATADKDLIFQCDDGSGGLETYFFLDGSLSGGDPITVFPDDSYLAFGPDVDMSLHHDGSNSKIRNQTGDLYITQNANGKDIVIQSDNGSGGVASYIEVDGDGVQTIFHKQTRHNDGINAYFGDDNDLLVGHNGTIGTIQAQTGDIQLKAIGSASDITFYAANTMLLSLDGGREVVHHHRGVEYNTVLVDNANHTVGTADHIILMHSLSTGRTVTIPTSQCDLGRVLIIKDRDGTGGLTPITIATEGSQTIDGAATKVVNSTAYGSVTIVCDGTNWSVI